MVKTIPFYTAEINVQCCNCVERLCNDAFQLTWSRVSNERISSISHVVYSFVLVKAFNQYQMTNIPELKLIDGILVACSMTILKEYDE